MALFLRGNVWWMEYRTSRIRLVKSMRLKRGDREKAQAVYAAWRLGLGAKPPRPIVEQLIDSIYAEKRGEHASLPLVSVWEVDQYAKDNNIGVSLIDKRVLSATYTTNGYVVTDDVDIQSVAAAFGIKVFSTLQLLQLLYECGKVKVKEIGPVIEYWNYENDLPTGFAAIHAWRNGLER